MSYEDFMRHNKEHLAASLKRARELLAELNTAARHARGCGKGIPLEGDPEESQGLMLASCECGLRQVRDQVRRFLGLREPQTSGRRHDEAPPQQPTTEDTTS